MTLLLGKLALTFAVLCVFGLFCHGVNEQPTPKNSNAVKLMAGIFILLFVIFSVLWVISAIWSL